MSLTFITTEQILFVERKFAKFIDIKNYSNTPPFNGFYKTWNDKTWIRFECASLSKQMQTAHKHIKLIYDYLWIHASIACKKPIKWSVRNIEQNMNKDGFILVVLIIIGE